MNIPIVTKTMRKSGTTISRLPSGKDLPDTDGIPMDNDIHREQANKYLIDPLRRWMAESNLQAFVSGNSWVYYDPTDLKRGKIGPDVYVVLGGRQRGQKQWVAWEEGGLLPTLAIELLSPTTEANDRGNKFVLLRDHFKTPDYVLFNTDSGCLEGFHRIGRLYKPVMPVPHRPLNSDWIACRSLPLWLGVYNGWLRWFDPAAGCLVWTDEERAEAERRKGEAERERAEAERRKAAAETERAEAESQRANRAEEELRRLLERLGGQSDKSEGGAT